MKRIEQHASFGGSQQVWQHASSTLGCAMKFGVYLPPQSKQGPCPVLYWLSGLTCNEQNFITKAGAQRYAAQHGVILIAPDTSPRGEDVADDDAYDLGQGAGFYLNATREPWAAHYRMYDYLVQELPALVDAHFPTTTARGISGHSMGGHGALVIALRNPGMYRSVSAFSPVVAPSHVPWGEKAFTRYLGDDREQWKQWDATELIPGAHGAGTETGNGTGADTGTDAGTKTKRLPLLIDQGDADDFLKNQLKPELLRVACEAAGHPLTLRMQPGYDHSYYFIASFIGEHIEYHAKAMRG